MKKEREKEEIGWGGVRKGGGGGMNKGFFFKNKIIFFQI